MIRKEVVYLQLQKGGVRAPGRVAEFVDAMAPRDRKRN